MAMSRVLLAVAVVWAAVVGVSVPFGLVISTALNKISADTTLHSFYISQISIMIGGLELVAPSVCSGASWGRPRRWWSLLGGVCVLPAFICVSASLLLGMQLTLMVQLVGIIGTFFALDILNGTVRLRDWQKIMGFLVAVLGVGVDNVDAFSGETAITGQWVFFMVATFVSGVGFALQSKCNSVLAQDLGSPARAAMVSALVCMLVGAPIMLWIWLGRDVPLRIEASMWWLWLLAGAQSALYIGSMAVLPKLLGFTTSYMLILAAKLITSTLIDAFGLVGPAMPVTWERLLSLALVLLGASTFNSSCSSPRKVEGLAGPSEDLEKLDASLCGGGRAAVSRSTEDLETPRQAT